MKARLRLLVIVAAGLLPPTAACTYDWTVGVAPADGGVAEAGIDATLPSDAARDGRTPEDATSPVDSPSSPIDAGTDTSALDATALACAEREKTLASDRVAAQTCTSGTSGQCTTYIVDECNCRHYVADAGSPAANAWVAAVAAFDEAGCAPVCDAGGCGPFPSGFCYPTTTGAGDLCGP